jgi:hypothetical protein
MASIDYLAIENSIKTLLNAGSATSGYNVFVEPPDAVRTDACPLVQIYLNSWDSPAEDELIGGTNPITTFLTIELWIYDFSFENLAGATARDIMLDNVKAVLKANRTLAGNVLITRFTGGEFDNQRNTNGMGFFKGVSLRLECEVRE